MRAARRFDLFMIGMEDVERHGAWQRQDRVVFSHEDTRCLRRIRKRNTLLFDTLADVCGHAYGVSGGVLETMLYEAVLVDFRGGGCVRCQQPSDKHQPPILPAEELQRTLYERGFYLTRPDGREVHFVPFVASASMSREDEYLFVNRERLDALLRAASLDMVSAQDDMPVLNGLPLDASGSDFGGLVPGAKVASAPKLAAYLGLVLSDGVSLRELTAPRAEKAQGAALQDFAPQWLLGLNEHNTICVSDWSDAPMQLDKYDHCWVNEETPRRQRRLPTDNVGDGQTEEQRQLQALFAAMQAREQREGFDALAAADNASLWNAWKSAIATFFAGKPALTLEEGRIPCLPVSSPQGSTVHACAVLYAACLLARDGEYLLARDTVPQAALREETEDGDAVEAVCITMEELQAVADRLGREETLRRSLWNLLGDENPAECRLLTAQRTPHGLRLTLRHAPCRTYRAALRHIDWKHPCSQGNQYDGCGFLDDDLFDELESLLQGEDPSGRREKLNAVQIRLPWCKGLLARFTASGYFQRWAELQGADVRGMTMLDAYGRRRPLFDGQGRPLIRAVFTDSMFKGRKWFGCLQALRGEESGDRWAEYWRRLRAHRVSMIIAGRSTPPVRMSRLNYQFLTTLGLSRSEMELLVDRRLDMLASALTLKPQPGSDKPDGKALASLLRGLDAPWEADEEDAAEQTFNDTSDEQPGEEAGQADDGAANAAESAGEPEGRESGEYLDQLCLALEKHPELTAGLDLVKQRCDRLVRSEVLQMMRGRLCVYGDVRYLLPDLLQMVRYMAERFLCHADGRRVHAADTPVPSAINTLAEDARQGFYFAPGDNAPWIHRSRRGEHRAAAILRNPHYAMGEEPVLSPLPREIREEYERWFGGLTGCVMVPNSVMYTINGADCDGDRVNVCADATVVSAIRRRAQAESALLNEMIRRRDSASAWLQEQADMTPAAQRRKREYLRLLAAELPHILPQGGRMTVRSHCPPLLYAGSASKGLWFSRDDLQGCHLRDKLWEVFCLSRQQRIGQMSLKMLEMTADAYAAVPPEKPEELSMQALLGMFLARYLMIAGALDTAMEIDMAKTGAKRENHALRAVPLAVRTMLGHERRSGFHAWRRLYQQRRRRLQGFRPDEALDALMEEYRMTWKPHPDAPGLSAEQGAAARDARMDALLPLDVLPILVHDRWTARRSELTRTTRHSLRSVLPPAGALQEQQLDAPQADWGVTLLERLENVVVSFDRQRRLAGSALKAGEGLHAAYADMLHWLLGNGFGLNAALEAMQALQGLLERWHGAQCPGDRLLSAVLRDLARLCGERDAAVTWGWAPVETRRDLPGLLLRACGGVQPFTEAESRLLACSPRSIVLLRHLAEYGWRDALLRERAQAGDAASPDQLERHLRRMIREKYPQDADELLYAACRRLVGRTYSDGGRQRVMMSEFLAAYLIGGELSGKIDVTAGGGDRA